MPNAACAPRRSSRRSPAGSPASPEPKTGTGSWATSRPPRNTASTSSRPCSTCSSDTSGYPTAPSSPDDPHPKRRPRPPTGRYALPPILHIRDQGEGLHRPECINDDDHTIVATYGAIYRGIVQYYLLAGNVYRLNRFEWVM